MKTKQFIRLSLALSIALTSISATAQENKAKPSQGSQLTLAYPVGTNGADAKSISNKFSLNVLYGVNGGLNGFEAGGIFNYNQGDVNGVQLAGVANINKERTSGLMWAGCFNLSMNDARGVQFADLNMATRDFTGFQAGVFNYARRLKGVQLGIVNIVGEDNGAVPIGLFNVVKGGYYALEIVADNTVHTNLNYKMGVERFYTIYKLGWSRYDNNPVYSVGLGVGSMYTLAPRHKISVDLSANHIVYNDEWNSDENFLAKLDLTYRFSMGEHVSMLAGPSFNWYVSEIGVNDSFGTLNIPHNARTYIHDDKQKWMWIGFNMGLAYTF